MHVFYVYQEALVHVCICGYTNSKGASFEVVQAVQSFLGLGQVLRKLSMQQPHGERHHRTWIEGMDGGRTRKQEL